MVAQASIPSADKDNEPKEHNGIGKHGQKNPKTSGKWETGSLNQ